MGGEVCCKYYDVFYIYESKTRFEFTICKFRGIRRGKGRIEGGGGGASKKKRRVIKNNMKSGRPSDVGEGKQEKEKCTDPENGHIRSESESIVMIHEYWGRGGG